MAKILIADDEPSILEVVNRALALDEHVVVTARDGEQALMMVRTEHPDLVLIDLFMPRKEGLETIMQLRKTNPELKIIAMSGGNPTHGMSFLEMAKRLGAHRALAKPFTITDLRTTVADLLTEDA
jgi:CheY-like chemotaxis protein